MGSYVYRVTATRVICNDGQSANVAVYAYKPYRHWGGEKENAKMHFRTGCASAEKLADAGKLSGRIVTGQKDGRGKVTANRDSHVYEWHHGTLIDDCLGGSIKTLEGVKIR